MQVTVQWATADRFDDVAHVLGPRGGAPQASTCWCLSRRLDRTTVRALGGPARRETMRELCARPRPPGVLAYLDGEVSGWAAAAPRAELPAARLRRFVSINDPGAWVAWCIRVRPAYRGLGVSHALLEGAVELARRHGSSAVEGHPVDTGGHRVSPGAAYAGTRKLFEAHGFELVAPSTARAGGFARVVMRRMLSDGEPAASPVC